MDEVTWLGVDVTSDGSTVFFDALGEIYSLPAEGGTARPVITGVAFDMQPALSPDDRRIAFVSDRSGSENLWISDTDGANARQLSQSTDKTEFSSPAWSPDGRFVYVSRRSEALGVFEMFRFDIAGGDGERILPQSENSGIARAQRINALGAAPSPDGRYLYYASKTGELWDSEDAPTWRIERLDLDNGEIEPVVSNGQSAMRPAVSPNGNWLTYAARSDNLTGLRLRNLHSGEDRWLIRRMERDNQDGGFSRDVMPRYDWASDGQSILHAADGKLWRHTIDGEQAQPIPFEVGLALDVGSNRPRLAPAEKGPVVARIIQAPSISPDGARIAFSALGKLFVQSRAGGEAQRISPDRHLAFRPAWLPDAKSVVYVTGDQSGGAVWRVRVGNPRSAEKLSDYPAHYTDPVVGPAGEYVYLLQSSIVDRLLSVEEVNPARESWLVRIPLAGGKTEKIGYAGVGARRLHFVAGDPRVFLTNGDGVVSIDLDSGKRETHFKIVGAYPWNHRHEQSVAVEDTMISPNGRWILARSGHQLHLLTRPVGQGEPPAIDLLASSAVFQKQISTLGADYFGWSDDGDTILWSIGSTLFSRSLSDDADLGETTATDIRVNAARDVHEERAVLRGATVLTMRGDEAIVDADLIVEGNRIVAVGPRGSAPIDAGAAVIDVTGRYVIPGFVDTHAHWYEIRRDVLVVPNWSHLMNLAYGVTAGMDVQAMDQDAFVYQDLVDAGLAIGPRVYSVGKGMFSDNVIESYADARTLLERYRDYYRTHYVKAYVTGNREQRRWISAAAAELGMLVTTEGMNDSKLDITHAIDGMSGNEHYPAMFPLRDDIVELFARTRIAYTPTALLSSGGPAADDDFFRRSNWYSDPKVRRFMPHSVLDTMTAQRLSWRDDMQVYRTVANDARRIMRRGGLVGIGSHAQLQGVAFHWEMQALAEGGWEPMELLRAATAVGAEILGLAEEIGTVETGKLADLIVLSADPRDDISNTLSIESVMKNGRLYDADTLDETWPRARPLPPQWHHDKDIYP
ncbi:MAG: amidohydrolase family protein [Pseudomonadota bacterium]